MELKRWQERFEELGVRIAAMSYDGVPTLAAFAADNGIDYPLLSDRPDGDDDLRFVDVLTIRNPEYPPGHFAYGVPQPGIFYVDADGVIALKRAEAGYRDRPSLRELRRAVRQLVESSEP